MQKEQPTVLTPMQKLKAIGFRFYQGDTQENAWVPKTGDLYTTSRADLELYRIVEVKDDKVYTEYCTNPGVLTDWPIDEFTSMKTFGANRVRVPDWCFDTE